MFPVYMTMGMSYEEYWHGPVWLAKAYREANEMKRRQEEWARHRLGAYIYDALLCVAPVMRATFGKGHVEPGKYPDEPWPLSEREAEEHREHEARERYYKMRAKLMAEAKAAREKKAEESAKKEASGSGND